MNDKALAQKDQASASDPIDSSRLSPKVSKEIVVKTVALIQDLPWSIAGAGWTMAATKVAAKRPAPDQVATVFQGTKGNYEKRK